MRIRDQLIGAAVLVTAAYFSVLRIAEAKCEAAIGSNGYVLDETRRDDLDALGRLHSQLGAIGQSALATRIGELQKSGQLWVAPDLGPEQWAAYVEALGLVRRIYIRRLALRDPRAHLYASGAPDVPDGYREAFAWLGLGGAMRHEIAHFDGSIDEADAYRHELAWYQEIQRSPFVSGLQGEARASWEWALDSAVLTVRKAAKNAGARLD